MSDELKPCEAMARKFHGAYERLAPQFGYETRPDTRAFDPASSNGKLMIAVVNEVVLSHDFLDLQSLFAFEAGRREADPYRDALRELVEAVDNLPTASQIFDKEAAYRLFQATTAAEKVLADTLTDR